MSVMTESLWTNWWACRYSAGRMLLTSLGALTPSHA